MTSEYEALSKINDVLGRMNDPSPVRRTTLFEMVEALQSARTVIEGTEAAWEYGAGYEGDNGIERRWFAMDGALTVREAAERDVERYDDPQVRLLRRRRPGPWIPVHANRSQEEQ